MARSDVLHHAYMAYLAGDISREQLQATILQFRPPPTANACGQRHTVIPSGHTPSDH